MNTDYQNEITFNVSNVLPDAELDRDVTRKVWYFHDRSSTTHNDGRNFSDDEYNPRTTFAIVMLDEDNFAVTRSIHNPNDIYASEPNGVNFSRSIGRRIARNRMEKFIFGSDHHHDSDEFMAIFTRTNPNEIWDWGLNGSWLTDTFDRIIESSKRYEASLASVS